MPASPISLLITAIDQATPIIKNVEQGVKGLFGSIVSLSFAYNEVKSTLDDFESKGRKAYDLLIGQNVELQKQLLATQSTLASTNKIIENGIEVKDPTKAIHALTEPVNQAIAELREGSFQLTGVISNEIIPLFQVVAGQSAGIGASLSDSAKITLSFAAAAQTLGVQQDLAARETGLILQSQISSENRLARSLGLNNEIINTYKSQGILVEKLNERLATFRAGNALAAQSIDGVTSNIKELVLEFGRVAGQPFLDPIVAQINVVFEFIKQNRKEIQGIVQSISEFFLSTGEKLGEAVKILEPVAKTIAEALFNQISVEGQAAAATLTILVDLLVDFVKVAAPVLQVIANIALAFSEIAKSDFGKILIETGLLLQVLVAVGPVLGIIAAAAESASFSMALFGVSGGGVPGLIAVLSLVSPELALIATAAAAAGGGMAGLAAAAATAAPLILAALAPLLPLIALGGAIALTLELKQTGDLKTANEELEEFRKQNDLLSDESLRLATKLKALNDAERENGKLTEEQARQRQGLQQITASQVKSLQDQIAAIKQIAPASDEQKRAQESQITQLQKFIDLLNKQSGGTKLALKDLPELGNTYQQLAKNVTDAQQKIKDAKTTEELKQAAETLIKLTSTQLQQGQISAEDAAKRLEALRTNTRLSSDAQISAESEITKARQGEVDKRVKAAEEQQQQIQVQIDNEQLSEYEGQHRITEAKKKELQIQLDAVKASIAAEIALRQQQVQGQLDALDKQIADAQKQKDEAEGKGDKGGVRIASEQVQRLEAQKSAAQASLGIDSDRLTQLKSQQQKFTTDIGGLNQQEVTKARQQQLKDIADEQTVLDAKFAARKISEEQFNAQSLQITRAKVATELQQINDQRSKLAAGDTEGQKVLDAKQAAAQKQLTDATEKFEGQRSQIRINALQGRQQLLDTEFAAELVSTAEYNQQSLTLTRQKAEAELQELERQKARLPQGDVNGRLALDAKEAEQRKILAQATEKFEADKSKARVAAFDSEQKQLEARLVEGGVTQQQFAQQSLAITQQQLQAELDEVLRQRDRLKTNDKQKLEELAAQEADIRKKQVEALENFQQQQLQIIEQAQKKALDAVTLSETSRLTTIEQLEASRTIRKVEAEKLNLDVTRDRITKELNLEKDKLAELQALPPLTDPRKEEERQSQIRQSQLKTATFTKSLVDNEIQQQEALFRVVSDRLDRQNQAQQNAAKEQEQSLNSLVQLGELITKSTANQVSLLQAQKELAGSIAGFYQGELDVLKQTTTNQREQKEIAETAAEIRLKSVRAQAALEEQILKLNLEQKQTALDQEKIQNRIQQIQARAATLTALSEQKKVEAKPDSTPEEKEAARLKTEASVATEVGLQAKEGLLDQQGELNQREGKIQIDNQRRTAQLNDDQARLNLANNRIRQGDKRSDLRSLRDDIRTRVGLGGVGTGNPSQSIEQLGRNFRLPDTGTPTAVDPELLRARLVQIDTQLRQQLGLAAVGLPSTTPQSQIVVPTVQQGRSPVGVSAAIAPASQATPSSKGDVNISITNQFTTQDAETGKAADKFTQGVRKELYDLGILLTRS